MKTIVMSLLVFLLLAGIVGTSINVFGENPQDNYFAFTQRIENSRIEKMSMRQIDSLTASSNLNFTIKNSILR